MARSSSPSSAGSCAGVVLLSITLQSVTLTLIACKLLCDEWAVHFLYAGQNGAVPTPEAYYDFARRQAAEKGTSEMSDTSPLKAMEAILPTGLTLQDVAIR